MTTYKFLFQESKALPKVTLAENFIIQSFIISIQMALPLAHEVTLNSLGVLV